MNKELKPYRQKMSAEELQMFLHFRKRGGAVPAKRGKEATTGKASKWRVADIFGGAPTILTHRGRAEFYVNRTLHNFCFAILCDITSCNFPETCYNNTCQGARRRPSRWTRGRWPTSAGRKKLQVFSVNPLTTSPKCAILNL